MSYLLQPLLDDYLHHSGRLRVWSLIVTVLGDTVEIRDRTIPTARLTPLLGRLGVSVAAQRTALSRLVADGWIERRKRFDDARQTAYGFTASGREEFVTASRLVYAAPSGEDPDHWLMCVSDAPRGVMVAPGVGIWPVDAAPRGRGIGVAGWLKDIPEGFAETAITPDHAAEVATLQGLTGYISQTFAPEDDLDALAARIVLIHRWRRHVLRYPELPRALAPEGWAGHDLRARVGAAYWALSPRADAWLEGRIDGASGLGTPRGGYLSRFGFQK